jgi:hypothetical protein
MRPTDKPLLSPPLAPPCPLAAAATEHAKSMLPPWGGPKNSVEGRSWHARWCQNASLGSCSRRRRAATAQTRPPPEPQEPPPQTHGFITDLLLSEPPSKPATQRAAVRGVSRVKKGPLNPYGGPVGGHLPLVAQATLGSSGTASVSPGSGPGSNFVFSQTRQLIRRTALGLQQPSVSWGVVVSPIHRLCGYGRASLQFERL